MANTAMDRYFCVMPYPVASLRLVRAKSWLKLVTVGVSMV